MLYNCYQKISLSGLTGGWNILVVMISSKEMGLKISKQLRISLSKMGWLRENIELSWIWLDAYVM